MSVKYNREQIIGALNEKGVNQPCHRCGNKTFALIDGFSKYHLSDNTKENVLGGTGVPVVLVGCNNCGSHLGHVFREGHSETGERQWINSICVKFVKTACDLKEDSLHAF